MTMNIRLAPIAHARSTATIQNAIDACYEKNGGTVSLASGIHYSGTLILKSNVNLHLESGSILKASSNLEDFPSDPSPYPSITGEYVTHKALLRSEGAFNISITGYGKIDGGGEQWVDGPYGIPSFSLRPRILYFRNCVDVHVSDVILMNSASWVQTYQSCRNVSIDNVTVDSCENPDIEAERYARVPGRNTDGLDIVDCQRVTVSNCKIHSGDDGICLKSLSPDEECRDITITNCIVSSNASGIKIGTESSGAFLDIVISNCVIHDTRIDGVSIITVDGAHIERVLISNISMRNIKGSPLFIRLGTRLKSYRHNAKVREPALRNILIQNMTGSGLSAEFASFISGVPTCPVENIYLSNLVFESEGGIMDPPKDSVPEHETGYPNSKNFGMLPSHAFYLRHVRNIHLDNIHVRTRYEDRRPGLFCENVDNLRITNSPGLNEPRD